MGYNSLSHQIFLENEQNKMLTSLSGDVLSYNILSFSNQSIQALSIENFMQILKFPMVKPVIRLTVLNRDETINYVIPNEDIVQDSVDYNEKYTNGQRKNLSFKLVNVCNELIKNSRFTTDRNQQIFEEYNLKMLQSISGDVLSYNIPNGRNINNSAVPASDHTGNKFFR